MTQKRLYCDLDGVVADFEKYYFEHFEHAHDSVSDEEMWKNIEGHGEFFSNLPVIPGTESFINSLGYILAGYNRLEITDPIILTACPKSFYKVAALQKREWVRKHLGGDLMVLPVLGGRNKALFMQNEGDVLIDDFVSNCKAWEKLGGKAVHHKNFADSLDKVARIFYRE